MAKAVASIVSIAKQDKQEATFTQFSKDLESKELSTKYFAIQALGEIGATSPTFQARVIPLLYKQSESEDEGTRQVVGESLGKLALANPKEIVPGFQQQIKSTNPQTRSSVLIALRQSLIERTNPIDAVYKDIIGEFFVALADMSLHVRRNAVLALDNAVRNKSFLVRKVVEDNIKNILNETPKKSEFVRVIDLGMMKVEEDSALENRKAAFELINHLLEHSFDLKNLDSFVENELSAAVKTDVNDVRILAFRTLYLLSLNSNGKDSLRKSLDKLVDAITPLVSKPAKPEDALPEEIVRGGLESLSVLNHLPLASPHAKLEELVANVNKGDLKDKLASALAQDVNRRQELRSSKN
eukprot:TRINITY_DN4523_c0_g1_i2.p1 TRINITY_DN4523_c0_g1~~TRINITY_DN4523_c0_g1_i2.p1  ORF type:complete len:385 (-),score=130.81 TRINITY_DN4523_c0_g1_i2:38-1102(-)